MFRVYRNYAQLKEDDSITYNLDLFPAINLLTWPLQRRNRTQALLIIKKKKKRIVLIETYLPLRSPTEAVQVWYTHRCWCLEPCFYLFDSHQSERNANKGNNEDILLICQAIWIWECTVYLTCQLVVLEIDGHLICSMRLYILTVNTWDIRIG